jgi:sulfatase modifying factor 1
MRIEFKFIVLMLFCCSLVFSACNTEKKETILPIGGSGFLAGELNEYNVGGVFFLMSYVPGGRFPTGTGTHTSPDQSGANPQSVNKPYWLGQTEVTYRLWYKVATWAVNPTVDHDGDGSTGDDEYSFSNQGCEGNDGATGAAPTAGNEEPVTSINWRNAMVWCNALTEWYNRNNGNKPDLDCVYYEDENYQTPLRASSNDAVPDPLVSGQEDQPFIKAGSIGNIGTGNCTAKGFRLPTSMEWECAARYIDGTIWTAGNHASGSDAVYDATTGGTDTDGDGDVDYSANVAVFNVASSVGVRTKKANALGLYDMSGNVWDWCFNWNDFTNTWREMRGGCWFMSVSFVLLGNIGGTIPPNYTNYLGFRIARTQ